MAWRFKRKRDAKPMFELEGQPDGLRRGRVGRSAVEIGRLSYATDAIHVREWGEGANLTVGAFCSIAPVLTVFLGGNHRMDWCSTFPFGQIHPDLLALETAPEVVAPARDVTIGNDVWIGANVTVMSGVSIADGAVIGANAMVTSAVGPYEIWGGNPARLIRTRFAPEVIARFLTLKWWDCPLETVRQAAVLLTRAPDPQVLTQLEAICRR